VVVADVLLYREGLVATLGSYPELEVVGAASNPADATVLIDGRLPDVAIVDMAMPGALDLIRDRRAVTPDTRLIAFAIAEDISSIIECAEAGAAGYVTANASIADLVSAIGRAAAGELLCTPRVAAELFRRMGEPPAQRDPGRLATGVLTVREREVLAFVRRGLSNKEIAAALSISESTVKNHVHHLLEKLDVGTRQQAAILSAPATRRDKVRLPPAGNRNTG
jgi:DNA-binding NarL/FixJ family response regulator